MCNRNGERTEWRKTRNESACNFRFEDGGDDRDGDDGGLFSPIEFQMLKWNGKKCKLSSLVVS